MDCRGCVDVNCRGSVNTMSNEDRFCSLFVKLLFGEVCEVVCRILASKGDTTLQQIVQHSGLSQEEVQKSLIVLIQHSLASVFKQNEIKKGVDVHVYRLDKEAMRHRMHLEKSLVLVKKRYDLAGFTMFRVLCQHGKLQIRNILDFCEVSLKDQLVEPPLSRDMLQAKFEQMVKDKIFMRAGTQTLSARRRLRRQMIESSEAVAHVAKKSKKSAAAEPDLGSIANLPALEPDREFSAADDADVSWDVYHDTFIADFQTEQAIEYAQNRVSARAGDIIRAMCTQYGANFDMNSLPELSAMNIQRVLNKNEDAASLSVEALHRLLIELCHPDVAILRSRQMPNGATGYTIDFRAVFSALKTAHVVALIKEKYGVLAARIYRLLDKNRRLEEKEIAEAAAASKKTVRTTLFTLLSAQFVMLQDIPRTANREPAKTFYIWGINSHRVFALMLDSFYFSWCNLKSRIASEATQARGLLGKLGMFNSLDASVQADVTPEEKAAYEKYKRVHDRLQHGVLVAADLVRLFKDCPDNESHIHHS